MSLLDKYQRNVDYAWRMRENKALKVFSRDYWAAIDEETQKKVLAVYESAIDRESKENQKEVMNEVTESTRKEYDELFKKAVMRAIGRYEDCAEEMENAKFLYNYARKKAGVVREHALLPSSVKVVFMKYACKGIVLE